jgi:hypothetical protein
MRDGLVRVVTASVVFVGMLVIMNRTGAPSWAMWGLSLISYWIIYTGWLPNE